MAAKNPWALTCEWTARNAFGGAVKTVSPFYARDGVVNDHYLLSPGAG
jgi:hypothetical protein